MGQTSTPWTSEDSAAGRTRLLRWLAWLAMAAVTIGFAYHAAHKTIDFRVYHSTTRAVLAGNRDLYGERSGAGWPMVYRLSPLFVLLFIPFALLPMAVASALWVVLKLFVLFILARAIDRHFLPAGRPRAWSLARWAIVALVSFPFLIDEFNSGNVQFFIFAAAAAAFCLLETRPTRAAALLALGTSIKVFPAFFIPYLWVRGHRRVALAFGPLLALFLMLPSVFFGLSGNLHLLRAWLGEGIGLPEAAKWGIGPDFSLRGVMARYLSTVTYAPDPNFRNINFAELSPYLLQALWLGIAAIAYAGLLLLAARLRKRGQTGSLLPVGALEYSLLFCAQLFLEPVTEQTYFAALLFPALILSRELRWSGDRDDGDPRDHNVVLAVAAAAVTLLAVPLLVPGAARQRLLAVYGPICWGNALLALAFLLLIRARLPAPARAPKTWEPQGEGPLLGGDPPSP